MASLPEEKTESVNVVPKMQYLSTIETYKKHELDMKNAYKAVVSKCLHKLTDGVKDYAVLRDHFGDEIYSYLSREECAIDLFSGRCLTVLVNMYFQMVGRNENIDTLSMRITMKDWTIGFTVKIPWRGKLRIQATLIHTGGKITFREKIVDLVFHTSTSDHCFDKLFTTKLTFDDPDTIFQLLKDKPIIEEGFRDIFRLMNFMTVCPTCHTLKWVRKYTRPTWHSRQQWIGGANSKPLIYATESGAHLCIRDSRRCCDKCINMWNCKLKCTICNDHDSKGVFSCYKNHGCCHRICYQKLKYTEKELNDIEFYSWHRYMF